MAVTPAQMGFPHVLQLARLDRIRELKGGCSNWRVSIGALTLIVAKDGRPTAKCELPAPAPIGREDWETNTLGTVLFGCNQALSVGFLNGVTRPTSVK